jgi:hypothetical protein
MPVVSAMPVVPRMFLRLLVPVVCTDSSCNTKPADPHQDQDPYGVSSHCWTPLKEVIILLLIILIIIKNTRVKKSIYDVRGSPTR